METIYKRITDSDTFEEFKSLLRAAKLPADDLDFQKNYLVGEFESSELLATGGLEQYDDSALLRSVAVKSELRGKAHGSRMHEHLLDYARKQNVKSVYLLTETAKDFFLAKGFVVIPRDEVSESVKLSSEFSNVCPVSAVAMRLNIRS